MEFTVKHNNNTEYSVEFNERVATIRVRDLNQGLYNTSLVLPIDAWYLLEAQRQEFRRFHMSRVPFTNNQEGTMNMEKEVEEMSGYLPYNQLVPAQYQTGSIDYEFHWEAGVDYSVNEDGTVERVYEGSIPRRATQNVLSPLSTPTIVNWCQLVSFPTTVHERVNDPVSFPTTVHESVNDLESVSESSEMLVLDNPLSPDSGSSARPIVIDSSSEQESLNPVTTVYQQPTKQPVLERPMTRQNLIEHDIELDILKMNSL